MSPFLVEILNNEILNKFSAMLKIASKKERNTQIVLNTIVNATATWPEAKSKERDSTEHKRRQMFLHDRQKTSVVILDFEVKFLRWCSTATNTYSVVVQDVHAFLDGHVLFEVEASLLG